MPVPKTSTRKFLLVALTVLGAMVFLCVVGSISLYGAQSPEMEPEPTYAAAPGPASPGPEDPLNAVDNILNRSLSSSLAYNAPESVQLGEVITIELLLNPSITEAELGQEIEESGAVVTGTIQVTPLMKAELKASEEAFDILPIHDIPEQPISATESTRWQWQVIARQEGTQRLTLVIYMLVQYNGQGYWREVETYRNDIIVEVTFGHRLRAINWEWLIGILATSGAIPFIWRWIKTRRQSRNQTISSK